MAILKLDYNALWESICKWSRKAGRAATRPVLLMWYVMRSKDTPRKDKWAIFGSLAYLVLPIDILDAKRLPIIGWLDEVASLAVMVRENVKVHHSGNAGKGRCPARQVVPGICGI